MSEQTLSIDTTFNFYSDSGGKDPDSHSPTLKNYHKLLWSKALPNGEIFTLTDTDSNSYLTYISAQVRHKPFVPLRFLFTLHIVQ